MTGSEKQLIESIIRNWHRLVFDGLYRDDVSDDRIMKGLEEFNTLLNELNVPVDNESTLGISVRDDNPVTDKFGV